MFDNLTNISLYNYEINLDTIIRAVCEISFDIGKQLEEVIELRSKDQGFTISDLFDDEFLFEIGVRPIEVLDRIGEDKKIIAGIGKEGLIAKITTYYNSTITRSDTFENSLNTGKDILILDRDSTTYLSYGDKGKERLLNAIKKERILKKLVSKLKSERIQKSLEKIEVFETDIFYKNVVESSRLEGKPSIAIVPYEWISNSEVRTSALEEKDVWINTQFYKKIYSDFVSSGDIEEVLAGEEDKVIGIKVNGYILPSINVEFSKYISQNNIIDYFYFILKNTYSRARLDTTERKEAIVQDFIQESENPDLNKLLSHLKNNFYIEGGKQIDAKFEHFFNSVVSFQELELLEDYHFLLSTSVEHETALGIYSHSKKHQEYNLLHWMNHENEKEVKHYRKVKPNTKSKKLVSTLKPSICYYFLSKYFEDILQKILLTNGNEFFSNHQFMIDNKEYTEVDFLVKCPSKLVYIEAKTKLSRQNIEGFVKRVSALIENFNTISDREVEIEFLLLGSFSDHSVTEYQYFIDENKHRYEDYNKDREGVNCIPYRFTLPIPDKEGKNITCVAEPEYDKLQKLLKEICPR